MESFLHSKVLNFLMNKVMSAILISARVLFLCSLSHFTGCAYCANQQTKTLEI